MRQLSQGASLYSIADGMGVAHGDVVNALESDLPAQTPGWTDVTSLADKIASATNTVTIAPPPSSAQQFTLDNGFGPQTLTMSLDATAHLLSTTSSDLMLQLSRGTSLYTIADAQGVAHGDVVTALESDLPAQTPGWTDVTALADKIASSTGSVTIAPPQSGTQQFALNNAFGPQTMTIPLDATASLLSTTPGDLMNQLSQGATLYSIADAQGVARGDLVTALEADLPAQTPGWTDIAALADQIASTSTGPVAAATSSGTQQFALNNAFGPQTMTMPLDATASLLSTTPADLMNQLSQGASLYSIADAQGVARADVMTALEADLPAETPGWTDVAALADQLASSTTSTTTPPTQL